MSTVTQYNPNIGFNEQLLDAGVSKTVYALVTPESEKVRMVMYADPMFADMFRGAWTGRQDDSHEIFFDTWHEWSADLVNLDRNVFPKYYPCNGASEPIRQLIFAAATGEDGYLNRIHFFEGEYEGYKAMAEAAGLDVVVHKRHEWHLATLEESDDRVMQGDLLFISQPSAIDGMIWREFNIFLAAMPANTVVVDLTYVGAVPRSAISERFVVNHASVRNVIFSLSKPFGVYYDRIGGVWCREEDLALFGNRWFKNLTSLRLGTELMNAYGVCEIPDRYEWKQRGALEIASAELGFGLDPCDVFILAIADPKEVAITSNEMLAQYLTRAGKLRVCLTPAMSKMIGTLPQLERMLAEEAL